MGEKTFQIYLLTYAIKSNLSCCYKLNQIINKQLRQQKKFAKKVAQLAQCSKNKKVSRVFLTKNT